MAQPDEIECWLTQAEADLRSGDAEHPEIAECHRRYWIQQSCEKAIKAYALIRWTGSQAEEKQFAQLFLLCHSPLKSVATAKTPLSKALHVLAREVEVFVRGLDNHDLLLKIDATTPTASPDEVSYRYPFRVGNKLKPPSEFDEWDTYQGNHGGAVAAVR